MSAVQWEVIKKLTSATTPAHGQGTVVAATVSATVGSVRVFASILTEDRSKLLFARERKSAIVLEKDGSIGSDLANGFGVVGTDIDVVVDLGVGFFSVCVLETESVL